MGHCSVHCGLSKIAITSGNPCYILPLQDRKINPFGPVFPLLPPIEGIYDDYGGIEDIKPSVATSLLEREGFDLSNGLRNFHFGFSYMWINKEVYDFMSHNRFEGHRGVGDFDIGSYDLLKALGFEYIGDDTQEQHFEKRYAKDGYEVKSNGTWLKGHILNVQQLKSKLPDLDISFFEGKFKEELYPILSTVKRMEYLSWIVGVKGVSKLYIEYPCAYNQHNRIKNLFNYKSFESDEICEALCRLIVCYKNMYAANLSFCPYEPIIPKDGGREKAQVILEKFAEINKGMTVKKH